jgi:hypothetical protein
MAIGPRYAKFLKDCADRGLDQFEAARLPEAREIYYQDSIEKQKQLESLGADGFTIIDENTGEPVTHFASEDQVRAAFRNELYKTSPGYRERVAQIMANTPKVPGVTLEPGALEKVINKTDDNSMLVQARKEAAIELRRTLFNNAGRSAKDRLALMEYLASEDAATQETVAEVESAHRAHTPLKDALIAAKQSGQRVSIQLESDTPYIDQATTGIPGLNK